MHGTATYVGVALISVTLLIGSSLATYYGHGSSSSNDACDRQFNTDCQCNCDCGDIYLPPPPPPCGNCPDKTMKKCITCSDALNNWDCRHQRRRHGVRRRGLLPRLNTTILPDGLSRRCAKYEECPLPILNGIMVSWRTGKMALAARKRTCEVYGCKASGILMRSDKLLRPYLLNHFIISYIQYSNLEQYSNLDECIPLKVIWNKHCHLQLKISVFYYVLLKYFLIRLYPLLWLLWTDFNPKLSHLNEMIITFRTNYSFVPYNLT
uniref:Uncharacterized protein n=1 Tax=Hydroides elegans TaxID=216498 RepID=A5LIM4_HYDEL|nr:hypothetical protein [Hydroides elegans]